MITCTYDFGAKDGDKTVYSYRDTETGIMGSGDTLERAWQDYLARKATLPTDEKST